MPSLLSPWYSERARRARWALYINNHRGVVPVEQLTLPDIDYTVDPEVMIGTTEWRNAAVTPPPVCGWWKCRTVRRGIPGAYFNSGRRFWDGRRFGPPVYQEDSDEAADECMRSWSLAELTSIEWCGLRAPHPGRYPYRLFATGTGLSPL